MRRIALVSSLALFALAACGSDAINRTSSSDGTSGTGAATATTLAAASGASTTTADASGSTTTSLDPGQDCPAPAADETTTTTPSTATTRPPLAKPTVQVPATAPTALKLTTLKPGTGEKAASGDSVVLNYLGVRSADGTEFDNSYERGEPLSVTLGQGQVIAGWDQGLVGVQAGGQYQLDVPGALAYGATPPDGQEIIKANDPLTFVVDVVAVVKAVTEAQEPKVDISPAKCATDVQVTDLVAGTGAEAKEGSDVLLHLIAYRGDNGKKIDSSWTRGTAESLTLTDQGTFPGIVEGISGMKVGGRRKMVIPAAQAFGPTGNSSIGFPANTDLILVVDLVASY
jgi:peptidylprolyl isomerase